MLIRPQKIEVKWSNVTASQYIDKGYPKLKQGEIFLVDIDDVSFGSNYQIKFTCDICGDECNLPYNTYNRKKTDIDICKKCSGSIETNCSFCQNQIKVKQSQFKKHKLHFCNIECRNKYTQLHGSHNNTREKYNCDCCNKEIMVKQYVLKELKDGKRHTIFCSRKCHSKWLSLNKSGKNHHSYSQVDKICEYCKKEYSVPKNQQDRNKYCSVECRQLASRIRIEKNCENCGEIVYKTPTDIKKNKNGLYYCSHKCANEHRSKLHREIRTCEICNDEFEVKKSEKKRFCSMKCQSKWQSEYLVGENANGFNRDVPISERVVNCDWCGEETIVDSPNKLKQILEENANHFCSNDCRRGWFANDWSQREENKLEAKIRAVKLLEDGVFGNTDTGCQIEVNKILDELNIAYDNEYNCVYVSIDNYLSDYNLMIEVMGTYWHTDHRMYKEINYQMQVDRIKNDKIKKSLILSQYNINILYLWEEDISNNRDLIIALIKEYINNTGILANYHSFNYQIDNNELNLIREDIPYMDYDIKNLHPLIDIKTKKRSMKQLDKWITFNCENCGEPKEQLLSHYKKSKTHCCSTECAYDLKKKNTLKKVIN